MTKDNEDALDVAEAVQCFEGCECPKNEAAAHLRRLVRENEAMLNGLKFRDDWLAEKRAQIEAKDALLRQAVEALSTYQGFIDDAHILEGQWHWLDDAKSAEAAIRQHLEGK